MATKNGDTKNGDTKSGGAGGTPLAVTQEDCLVIFIFVTFPLNTFTYKFFNFYKMIYKCSQCFSFSWRRAFTNTTVLQGILPNRRT